MTVNTIMLFTIVASFVVFGQVQTGVALGITFEQFLGERYILGAVGGENYPSFSCGQIKVTNPNGSVEDYIIEYNILINGSPDNVTEHGKFKNSELIYEPALDRSYTVFTVDAPHDASEFLIVAKNQTAANPYVLLTSRNVNISDEGRRALEQYAKDLPGHVIDITRDNC